MKADKKKMEQLIKTVKGQMDGILKMMDEDRYCIDISNQILSAQAILSKVNREVLKVHLEHCVQEASNQEENHEKIQEFKTVLDKLIK